MVGIDGLVEKRKLLGRRLRRRRQAIEWVGYSREARKRDDDDKLPLVFSETITEHSGLVLSDAASGSGSGKLRTSLAGRAGHKGGSDIQCLLSTVHLTLSSSSGPAPFSPAVGLNCFPIPKNTRTRKKRNKITQPDGNGSLTAP